MSFAVIQEQSCPATERVDQQIKVTVAIHVGNCRTRGILTRTRDSGGLSDVLKLPVPEVAIQNIVAFEAAEIDVAKSVAVHVSQRNTGTTQQVAIHRALI